MSTIIRFHRCIDRLVQGLNISQPIESKGWEAQGQYHGRCLAAGKHGLQSLHQFLPQLLPVMQRCNGMLKGFPLSAEEFSLLLCRIPICPAGSQVRLYLSALLQRAPRCLQISLQLLAACLCPSLFRSQLRHALLSRTPGMENLPVKMALLRSEPFNGTAITCQ